MTDAFANLVGPIFEYLITLQRRLEMGESPRLEPERGQILALLDTAEQQAGTSGQTMLDFSLAKHALVYWIDEVLVNSSWGQDSGWREHILEWDIFQERLRADRFFEKAQEAETLPGTDALETFFLCVALGFRGQFIDNRAGLLRWSERTYARLLAGSRQPDRFLPDDPSDAEREPLEPLPGKTMLLGVSILVSVTALLTLAGFLLAVRLSVY